jgi:Zn-dependent protease with chaperone function
MLFVWAIAPYVVGLVMLLLVFSPSLSHLLGFGVDHCHTHDHHAHLCLVHSPLFTGGLLEQWILVGTGVAVLSQAFTTGRRLRLGRRAVNMLLALAKPSAGHPHYEIVASEHPFAITAGVLRPRVLVSSGLLDALSPTELATVLSHEQAHQRRRDTVRLVAADTLSALHLPSTRRFIREQLHLAVEQACDEVAAIDTGDRLQVAETILKMTRLATSSNPMAAATGASVTGSDTIRRVEGLLRPPLPMRSRISDVSYLVVLGSAIALTTNDWWHHRAETLLSFLLG